MDKVAKQTKEQTSSIKVTESAWYALFQHSKNTGRSMTSIASRAILRYTGNGGVKP
jgi:hypothetical protein